MTAIMNHHSNFLFGTNFIKKGHSYFLIEERQVGDTGGPANQKAFFKKFEFSTKPQLIINFRMRDYRTGPREQSYIV